MKIICSLLFLVSSYSYSEEYIQQYQVGDTGPNGGVVTSVDVTSDFIGEEVVQEGDFLEITYTYEYTETVIEEVEEVRFSTTTIITPVRTPNLITDDSFYTDTNTNLGGNYGMSGADFTTGNQQMGGGSRVYEGSFEQEDIQSLDYGVTVYSHGSNAVLPECENTTGDCRDDFRITVSLFHEEQLVDTITHEYIGINWSGSRDYSFTEDVSSLTFDYGKMELYGIDRGFYGGYYGPGFSDPYVIATYNVVEEIVNRIVSYTTMQTVNTTDVYVYDSVYSPQVQITNVDIQPVTESSFEVIVEAESFDAEIVEVFEVEFETLQPVSEIEIEFESVEMEMEMVDEEMDTPDPVEEVETRDQVDDGEIESVEDTESEEQVEAVAENQEADETEEPVKETVEEKPRAKPSNYSVVMDSVKVALMVQNEATQAFTEYRQQTIPDVSFYSPVSLDGGKVVDNPYGRWMTGASEVLWDNMVDLQWQK